MPAATADVRIAGRDGVFDAYRALPALGVAPAIVLISPIYGVTEAMRALADRYAEHGFIALAPDSFWRRHPGPLARSERDAALTRGKEATPQEVLDDVEACIETLRAMPECNGKIGIAGFCFGGKYAFLAAARGVVGAAAAFHGTAIGTALDEAPAISVPLSLHFGGDDSSVPMEEVHAIEAALAGKPNVEIVVYPGVEHGFTQPDDPRYDRDATERAETSAFAMFSRFLR